MKPGPPIPPRPQSIAKDRARNRQHGGQFSPRFGAEWKNLVLPLQSTALAATGVPTPARSWTAAAWTTLAVAAAFLVGTLIWQAITAGGAPDPTRAATGSGTALFDIGVLVFREGLECILVLSAILAGMGGTQSGQRQPVAWGAGAGFLASVGTWFVAVGIIDALSENVGALKLQAATGLVAVAVLLVVMNWFFHKVYWGGWITLHNRRRKLLVQGAAVGEVSRRGLFFGLALLGFTTFYREGFEVVLFLQTYRLKLGGSLVLGGLGIGLLLSGIMAVLEHFSLSCSRG